MSSPRWSKVRHDLTDHKARSILIVLTIAVGVFAIGFVADMFITTLPDLNRNYEVANAHSGFIYVDPFDDDLIPSLKKVPGVAEVVGRSSIGARVRRRDGEWVSFTLSSIPALADMKLDLLRPDAPGGTIPPLGEREIYIDRTTRTVLGVSPGDSILIEMSDGTRRQLKVAAYVFDVTIVPYAFSQSVIGYAAPETIEWLGGSRDYTELYYSVAEKKTDEAHVKAVGEALSDKIAASGREVYVVVVFRPGRHFAADITAALGSMMMVLGLLSVGVSAFLVINTMNALLSQQVRQIGVMKAVGASRGQIVSMYLALTICFGLLAFLVAAPLGLLMSATTNSSITGFLNFDPSPFRIAPQGLILQGFVALVIPLLAALWPVLAGAGITVREAITSYGLGRGTYGNSRVDRLVEKFRLLPRPLLISIRNTFRRKGRLFLTLSALVLAGAIFLAVFNLRASLDVAVSETFGYILSDVNVGFGRAYRNQRVIPLALSVPGVERAEAWGGALGSLYVGDEETGTKVQILAPPSDSNLIKAALSKGRWLLPEDQNAIIISNGLLAARPELDVGDEVLIDIEGTWRPWKIVGVYRMVGTVIPPLLYANNEYLSAITHRENMAGNLRVVTTQHDPAFQKRVANDLEALFKQEDIEIGSVVVGSDLVRSQTATLDVLVFFLMIMAVLIAVVGGLGMTSTMGLNVFERTREIGVMRAIGASNGSIFVIVIAEGIVIGVLSWLLGIAAAWPISNLLAYVVGMSILFSPLQTVLAPDGLIIWLVLILGIAILASLLPARNAVKLTVREILAYE